MRRRPKDALHPTTEAVWAAIQELMDARGFAPSRVEIARRAFTSPSNVLRHLDKLAALGVIEFEPEQPRSIRLLKRQER